MRPFRLQPTGFRRHPGCRHLWRRGRRAGGGVVLGPQHHYTHTAKHSSFAPKSRQTDFRDSSAQRSTGSEEGPTSCPDLNQGPLRPERQHVHKPLTLLVVPPHSFEIAFQTAISPYSLDLVKFFAA